MRTLILYGTKYGATEVCANKLKSYLTGKVDVVNVKDASKISLDCYKTVIIGSPVYAGGFNGDIKKYIEANKVSLVTKKLGIFTSCMSDEKIALKQFNENLPKEILESAKVKMNLGGIFDFSKMNFFEKAIVRMIAKKDSSLDLKGGKVIINKIDEEAIKSFARTMEE